jgi:hypothetical protein
MSSFLQRLVSSAIRPTASVHPVIAPLFSTPQHETASQDFEQQTSVAGAPGTFTRFETNREPPTREAYEEAIVPGSIPMTKTARLGRDEDHALRYRSQSSAMDSEVQGRLEQNSLHLPTVETPEVAASQPDYSPLLPEIASPGSLHGLDSPMPSVAPQTHRDAPAKLPNTVPDRREPDEIQITIGRIEVTAVPQSPARPAPKPGRKSLSLDEYLRRADGRGR